MTDFGKLRYDWLEQVAADRTIPPFAFKVAFIIACRFLNRQSGEAWPTQETLARIMEATPRGIRKALDQLASGGHMTAVRGRSRGAPNRYSIVLIDADLRNDGSSNQGADYRNHGSGNDADYRNDGSGNEMIRGTVVPPLEEPWFLQNHMNEPHEVEEQEETISCATANERLPLNDTPFAQIDTPNRKAEPGLSSKALEGEFEEWWPLYPRKKSKGKALPLFIRIRQSGVELEALRLGAMRYAAETTGKDPQYIKHPTTWLNGKCWLDEPEPAFHRQLSPLGAQIIGLGQALERRRQAGMTGTASAVAGIMSAMGGHHDD